MTGNADAHRDLVKACIDYLQLRRAWVLKVWGNGMMRPGVPDILAGIGCRSASGQQISALVAIEVKTGNATLRPAQACEKRAMEAAGVTYCLVRQPEDLEDALLAAGLIDRPVITRRDR